MVNKHYGHYYFTSAYGHLSNQNVIVRAINVQRSC